MQSARRFDSAGNLSLLKWLNRSCCFGIRRFAPLESLLPTLSKLSLFACNFDDLPQEVCGESWDEDVLDKVRAHYEDLKSGQRTDAELKVLFLAMAGQARRNCAAVCAGIHSIRASLRLTESSWGRRPWIWAASRNQCV
jgi:hypothetical protein